MKKKFVHSTANHYRIISLKPVEVFVGTRNPYTIPATVQGGRAKRSLRYFVLGLLLFGQNRCVVSIASARAMTAHDMDA